MENQNQVVAFSTAQVADQIGQGIFVGSERIDLSSLSDAECVVSIVLHNGSQIVDMETGYKAIVAQLSADLQHIVVQPNENWNAELESLQIDLAQKYQDYQLELVAGLRHKQTLWLFGIGAGQVCLFRQGQLGTIYKASNKSTVAKGKLVSNDILVVASQAFFEKISFNRLQTLFSQVKDVTQAITAVAEKLAVVLQSDGEAFGSVGILAAFVPQIESAVTELTQSPPETKQKTNRFWTRFNRIKQAVVYVQVDEGYSRRQKFGGLLFVILLSLLAVSVGVGWRRRIALEQQEVFESVYQPATDLLTSAQRTAQVNRLGALDQVTQLREEVNQALSQFELDSEEYVKIQELQMQTETLYAQLSGENRVTPQLYLDLNLVTDDFTGEHMELSEGNLLVLDSSHGKMIQIGAASKQAELIAAGSELLGAQSVAVGTDFGLVFSNNGIQSIDLGSGSISMVVPTEDEWGSIVALGGFGANAYIIDAEFGDLWRYRAVEDGEWARKRWLAPGIAPDFSQVTDMMIDGDIWVLSRSGQIVRKYTRGASGGVEIFGLPQPFDKPTAIYVDELVYVFDASQNRVVEFSAEGEYLRQFIWETSERFTDMVVFEQRVLLLSGSKVFEVRI